MHGVALHVCDIYAYNSFQISYMNTICEERHHRFITRAQISAGFSPNRDRMEFLPARASVSDVKAARLTRASSAPHDASQTAARERARLVLSRTPTMEQNRHT